MSKKIRGPMRSVHTTTMNLPTGPRVPMMIESYHIASWRPTKNLDDQCTEVHFQLNLEGLDDITFVMRLKSRRAIDELIGTLSMYADEVWPPKG